MLEKYMREYSERNKAKTTLSSDASVIKNLNRHLGEYFLTEITPKFIARYKGIRRDEGWTARVMELSQIYHTLTKKGLQHVP